MNRSRRKFIKTSGLALAGAALVSKNVFAMEKTKAITGLQLYSVRDDMKADPYNTLKKLSDMGYRNLEHANYVDRKFYGYGAKEFKKVLDDLGLHMKSGHTVLGAKAWDETKNEFTDSWKYTVEDAAVLGQDFVISPSLEDAYRKDVDKLKGFLALFNKSGELCKKSGMKFGYHNHDFEFNTTLGGELMYDIILKETDPALVVQQLDMGNMYNAGAKALDMVKKYSGRYASLHVKDEIMNAKGDHYESTILGTGVIPVKEILELSLKSGTVAHLIIEQESYQGKTPLDCAKEDLAVMKKWGY